MRFSLFRCGLFAGLTGACLALAVLATAASAGTFYTSPQTLSAAGQDAYCPQVAIDSSGRATVVWERYDGTYSRIQAVRLDAGGTPGAVQTLSAAGRSAFCPQVAIDNSDRATITWQRGARPDSDVQSVRLGADGTPGPVQTLSTPGMSAEDPQIAIDGSDRATIVWRGGGAVQSVRLAGDGTPGAVQTLSATGGAFSPPRVAVDSSDRATITWDRFDFSISFIHSVRLAADGTPGPVQTFSAEAYRPQVAIDGSDRATITWYQGQLRIGTWTRIESVRLAADGTPGAVQTVSEVGPDGDAYDPQVAIDGSGRATITWTLGDFVFDTIERVQSVRLAADGTPGPVQTLSGAGQSAAGPQVAIDDSDRATITWERSDGYNTRIQAVRLTADGSPEAVETLSKAGQDADGTQVAVDDSDRATITWSRSDGANTRIQSVRSFTLRGSATAKKKQKQKGKKIVVTAKVKAGEELTAEASGKVEVMRRSYGLTPASKSVSPGQEKPLKLKPKRSKDAKRIAKALKRGKKAKAKLEVELSDEAGSVETTKLSVKLKR